ncbi:hypothetical protein [Mycolicibacterium goodii]|uniref:Uncharacterized protein n=1 Tax=Mycolicibacterium goodii TaxID=134601 RepID=A0A0K0X0B1_MYCGD|nr:hypothetical protein AFA91_01630 [Mycolicibacterium goodii]
MTHDNTALPQPMWPADDAAPAGLREPGTLRARLAARLLPRRYDRKLLAGVPPQPGSALAVHVARLTSRSHRRAYAFALRQVLRSLHEDPALYSSRLPLHDGTVASAATLFDEIRERLEAPAPIRAHGVARLRMLLSDGSGPVYRGGEGNLTGHLRAVLAEL